MMFDLGSDRFTGERIYGGYPTPRVPLGRVKTGDKEVNIIVSHKTIESNIPTKR